MEEEWNLIDYWYAILRRRMTIALIVASITTVVAVAIFFRPNMYRAEATIMPVGGQAGGGALSIAMANLGLGGVLGGIGGASSSSSQIMVILKSRTLAEKMIEKYGLEKILYPEMVDEKTGEWKVEEKDRPKMEGMVLSLWSKMKFEENIKDETIAISAETEERQLSADLVNGYLRELINCINENTFTSAKRNRIFIENQLERSKAELLESGKEISEFYSVNKISNVVSNLDVNVSLSPQGASALDEGPLGVLGNLTHLKDESNRLQKKSGEIQSEIDKLKVVKSVPQQVYLQYLILKREMLRQINGVLSQQYELAKIDEVKEELNFQVIDIARTPVAKSKPQRRLIVMATFVLSFCLAVFYAFFREYLEKARRKAHAR